tara:strand:+ start:5969 stop:6400 length:432 start_codon:yes stop_codon:yes gene_type:complete
VRYDDASLYTRFGYLIGHELAHHTLASPFVTAKLAPLVAEYPAVQHAEAIADIVAAIAIVRSGKATPAQVCESISQVCALHRMDTFLHRVCVYLLTTNTLCTASQIWCARVPTNHVFDPNALHPPPNERGDKLCRTLRNIGVL